MSRPYCIGIRMFYGGIHNLPRSVFAVVLSDYNRYMKYLCAHMDARAPSLTGVGFPGLLLGADAARPVLPNDARLPGVLRRLALR